MHIYIYIYIYIDRERERKREWKKIQIDKDAYIIGLVGYRTSRLCNSLQPCHSRVIKILCVKHVVICSHVVESIFGIFKSINRGSQGSKIEKSLHLEIVVFPAIKPNFY